MGDEEEGVMLHLECGLKKRNGLKVKTLQGNAASPALKVAGRGSVAYPSCSDLEAGLHPGQFTAETSNRPLSLTLTVSCKLV